MTKQHRHHSRDSHKEPTFIARIGRDIGSIGKANPLILIQGCIVFRRVKCPPPHAITMSPELGGYA